MRSLLLLIVFIPSLLTAQKLSVDLFGGFSNYQGDLQEKMFTTDQSKGAFGLGLRYDLTSHLALRTNFTYGMIGASDSKNKNAVLKARNLSFETKITEVNLLVDYNIFSLEEKRVTPYLFAGLAVFHFNPYTFDSSGNKVYLRPLSTEGQGLAQYPNRKPYHLTQLAIPFGAGIRWRVTDNVMLGYEIGLRKTFTDYLDDVSTNYVDRSILLAAKGPKAVEMAYRGGEIKNGSQVYPADGTMRGSPKYKDWYYFSGITLSIGLHGNDKGFGGYGRGRGNIGCPKL